jgi:N-acetylglucosamine-6-phosphate deacetylase
MRTLITAERLCTPEEAIEKPVLVIEDGRVAQVSSRQSAEVPEGRLLELQNLVLAPAFFDIHIHGGAGCDVMEARDHVLKQIESHLVRYGVGAYLPTTVTAPEDRTLRSLEHLGKAILSWDDNNRRARPIGIHLEGPFISSEKRGVHPSRDLVLPSPRAFDKLWQASQGTVRMMTIAPELPGALETIRHACALGVQCSLGHSDSSYERALAAISAGALHATHTFNAMRSLDHRDPGILCAVLRDQAMTADIIADGIHVHPAMVELFIRNKGLDRSVLITDAISATGMPDGIYKLGEFEVEVKDNRCQYQGKLAGSVLTMDQALRNVMRFANLQLEEALKMATSNPARRLGCAGEFGRIAPGCRADLVALTPEGNVVHTILGGEIAEMPQ